MKQGKYTILKNEALTTLVWRMELAGDTEGIRPGQFVDIRLPELFLRRPISVCDCVGDTLTLR